MSTDTNKFAWSQPDSRVGYSSLHTDKSQLPRMQWRLIRRTSVGTDGKEYPFLSLNIVMCDEQGTPVGRLSDEAMSVSIDHNGETKLFMRATLETALADIDKYDIIDDLPLIVEDRIIPDNLDDDSVSIRTPGDPGR